MAVGPVRDTWHPSPGGPPGQPPGALPLILLQPPHGVVDHALDPVTVHAHHPLADRGVLRRVFRLRCHVRAAVSLWGPYVVARAS